MNDELAALRQHIDEIDEQLVALLAKRFDLTAEVGQLKKKHNLPATEGAREAAQMKRIEQLAFAHGLAPELAKKFLRIVIDEVVARHQRV
ncbi:MAG TPA: chorismate mutase [Rhodocyclaceae bacterium]|nr:chorismate mutase [Rhodocyclaceae bacterium]